MHRLRPYSHWLAALMLLSVLPLVGGPLQAALWRSADVPYGDWLRTQLRVPADAAFEEAVERATAAAPASFEAFLWAFVEAYGSLDDAGDEPIVSDPTALAAAFSSAPLNKEALVAYLQGQVERSVQQALLPRPVLAAAASSVSLTSDRQAGAILTTPFRAAAAALYGTAVLHAPATFVVLPLRLLSAAEPLGP